MSLPQVVSIFSAPRSGSSWLGQVFNSSPEVQYRFQPLFSYAFKGRLDPNTDRADSLHFLEELLHTDDKFILQDDGNYHVDNVQFDKSTTAPRALVFKEVRYLHILPNLMAVLPEIKVIGLVRHPCAVIDSWINAPREFKPEWNVMEQWRSGELKNQGRPEEFFGFDKWKEVAGLFVQLEAQYPERMKVVRYADLNADPIPVVQDLFEFCELNYSPEVGRFIQESRSKDGNDAYSVYRKTKPDETWKNRLPGSIIATIHEELRVSSLERFL